MRGQITLCRNFGFGEIVVHLLHGALRRIKLHLIVTQACIHLEVATGTAHIAEGAQ